MVVISPATTTRPVVTRVSQATLLMGSSASAASRMVSEIWSAILSGWPSVTDSEVKRWVPFSFWSSAAFQAVIPSVFSAILYSPFLSCSLLRCGTCCVISALHEGLVREHRHPQSAYPLVRQPRLCEVRKEIRSSNSSLRFRLKSSPPSVLVSRSHDGERLRRSDPSTHLSESPPQELAPATGLAPRRLPRFHRACPSTALDERRRSPGVFGCKLHHVRQANAMLPGQNLLRVPRSAPGRDPELAEARGLRQPRKDVVALCLDAVQDRRVQLARRSPECVFLAVCGPCPRRRMRTLGFAGVGGCALSPPNDPPRARRTRIAGARCCGRRPW